MKKVETEVELEFVGEVKSYLPAILRGIEEFRANPGQADRLEEAYRHVHTIKGASSLVGLSGLSHIAFQLEETLQDIAAGLLPAGEETWRVLGTMVRCIETYLDSWSRGQLSEAPLLEEVTRAYHRLRGPAAPAADPLPEPPPFPAELPDLAPPDVAFPESAPKPAWAAADLPAPEVPAFADDLAREPLPEPPPFPADTPDFPEPVPSPDPTAAGIDLPKPASEEPAAAQVSLPEPGAGTAPAAAAEEVPAELLEVFTLEAEEHLRNLAALVPTLEQNPGDRDCLQEIRRSAHTLKGCAGMVGFQSVTQLAHRMEDLLDLLYEGRLAVTPEIVRLLLASTDALEDLAAGRAAAAPVGQLYDRYAELLAAAPPEPAEEAAAAEGLAESQEVKPAPAARQRGQFVRIPIERLDDLVKLVSELVITRSSVEQRMADFARQVNELQLSTGRLRRVSHKLETEFEASALGGGRLGGPVPGAPEATRRPPTVFRTHGFDDLEFDRYTEFHLQSRALAETTSDIQTVAGDLGHVIGDFDGFLNRQARLTTEIEDKLRRLRMVPLATLNSRLQRTVRTVAAQAGKQVVLCLEGEGTELDKSVLEAMSDPLLHLLRNAVDHGIEPPDVRLRQGKPARGVVRLRASHEGSQVVLQVGDDGAGLDLPAIREAAVGRGLLGRAEADRAAPEDLYPFIFLPGFSTARRVSEISGRGVGMDVVKAQVDRLKGTLAVDSRPGQGVTFTIRLPMTLAVTRALLVKANQETFALPLDTIRQILRLEKSDLETIGREPVVRVGGEVHPAFYLGRLLGLKQPADETVSRPPVVILQVGGRQVALVVDHLLGGREIVVKGLGSHLRSVRGIAGATLLGDGRVVLILNPGELLGFAAEVASQRLAARPAAPAPARRPGAGVTVLVVDDSPSMRRVVSTLVRKAGWSPVPAKDGLEALELLHQAAHLPDLILLDVEMPRMDGYELLSALKSHEAYAAIPVVMVTSRAGDKHRRKALDLGAAGYVLKPYQEEVLLGTLRQLVGRARQVVAS